MKTKMIATTISGVLVIHSIALATPQSRVADIGHNAIVQGAREVTELRKELSNLDKVLAETALLVAKRNSEGNISKGIALANAAIATGLSLMAYNRLAAFREMKGALNLATAIATGVSVTANSISQLEKGGAPNLKIAEESLAVVRSQVASQVANDKDHRMDELNSTLSLLASSLQNYKEHVNDETTLQLKSMTAQVVGVTIVTMGSLSWRTSAGMATGYFGHLVLLAGNIGPFLALTQSDDSEVVLAKIQAVRKELSEALKAL